VSKTKASPTANPKRDGRGEALTDADREALVLAIEIARRHSPADRQQIDGKLARGEPWFAVAVFAAHGCQERALRLPPWQCWPPCTVEPDEVDAPGLEHRGIGSSAALLRRMLAAGVSRFHPDPVSAIERAEAASEKSPASRGKESARGEL
jgi:hypothetical protein